jgi:hypothetical protein|tara:strand:+ start:1746 stop:1958 length:213 start_codon:yes stop_codon:yes gene_type:complete
MDVVAFSQYLYKVLRTREQDIADALVSGSANDWESYKMMVGEARGLAYAIDELKALLEKNADDVEDFISS